MTTAVSLIFGGLGLFQQMKAQKAQEKAMKAQQKAQELADARERRKLLRQTSIQRGEALNLAASLGGMGGTALAGGLSGLMNQQQAQLGFQQTTLGISKYITGQNIAASNALSTASIFKSLGNMAGSFPNASSGDTTMSPYRPIGSGFTSNTWKPIGGGPGGF